jgi:UDP-glucose 4-epimerase
MFARTDGMDVVIVRPFCVYGPGEDPRRALVEVSRYLRWHLNGRPIQVIGDARRKTRDFIHVNDVVKGLIHIASNGEASSAYNLGSGTETSMLDLINMIGSCTDTEPRYHEVLEVLDDTYRLVADITAVRALGFEPATTLETGIDELIRELGSFPQLPSGPTLFRANQRKHEETS